MPETRQLIQAAQHLDHPTTREREVRALEDAIMGMKIYRAIILSDTNEANFEIHGVPVQVRSMTEQMIAAEG